MPRADALCPCDASQAVELFWDLNMRMYKAMSLQRKTVYFLSACANVDAKRYSVTS